MQSGYDLLRAAVSQEERRKQLVLDAVRHELASGQLPVSDAVLEALNQIFPSDALKALRTHPGCRLDDKVQSVRATLSLLVRAEADLMATLGRFHEYAQSPLFMARPTAASAAELEASVRKELFAFSSLAHSLVDQCRRVRKEVAVPDFAERCRKAYGADGLHEFIVDLRNALHHQRMVEADWLIRGGPNPTSHFTLSIDELLEASDDWSEPSLRFMNASQPPIDVAGVVCAYAARAKRFYDWYLPEVERIAPAALADYRRCVRHVHGRSSLQAWKLLLHTFINNRVDPYPHLAKYLTADELKQYARIPRGSRELVDVLINKLDSYSVCDAETRELAYQLFGVDQAPADRPSQPSGKSE